jgi:chromosome segregation protein
MLKRLELVGFKSFAEKTLFDFSGGITAIVGPNGSGKSNIVDAVRWVLGEQSAKSLRGGEMADVIFQGSATRRSLGMAEVTMTFVNDHRALATDAEEVQITRRVYRGGEGEYLVNQQPSRLKDIKQLFLGSGAGADAYAIIEQGRVDVLLQASTKERRTIFEEAAGISRFKAKKIETLRKLERTDQNLQRLRDIVEEVEKQLRSVKLQASKAQRYREHAERLKELRIGLGLQEYHQIAGKLDGEIRVLEELRARLEEQETQARSAEDGVRRIEEALQQLDAALHEWEGRLAGARQQIVAEEATATHETSLSSELEADVARTRGSLGELSARVAALTAAAARAADEWRAVESQCAGQRDGVRLLEDDLQAAIRRLAELHSQVEADKNEHVEQMRQVARLQNDAVSHRAHLDNLTRECERLRHKSEQAAEHLASLDVELLALRDADGALLARLTSARQALSQQRRERDELRQRRDETTQRLADLRAEQSGLASRIEVLEGLERSHEGLGAGVREVLDLVRRPDPGPWRAVRGMIADLLTVRREYAPLVDLALGDLAQRFVVEDAAALHAALEQRGQPFAGRVSFLPVRSSRALPVHQGGGDDTGSTARSNRLIESSSLGKVRMPISADGVPVHPGVLDLAASLVTCADPELAHLPGQLLGQTLLVRDLDAAREIAAYTSGYRFVTLQGELLDADGTLTVGTHHAETGILSRKSELRELSTRAAGLDARITTAEGELAAARERLATFDTRIEESEQEIAVLAEQAADLRTRIGQHKQRREGLHEEVTLSRTEMTGIEREIQDLESAWRQARDEAARAEARVQALHDGLRRADAEIRDREQQRQMRQEESTRAKVALGQVEERLTAVRAKHEQIEADLDERRRERLESANRLHDARARLGESQRIMLQCTATLAQCYLDKEAAERRVGELTAEREQRRTERQALAERARGIRDAWRAEQEQAHARELEVSDLRHRRDTLVARLSEDYQVSLRLSAAGDRSEATGTDQQLLAIEPIAEGRKPEAEEEIAELRRKLDRLGSVNLDALQELAELETRAAALQAQLDDLSAAQRALQEIIAKINQDSRRLFTESFDAIRVHFQELFRKLFGGGQADAVLEDESDVLESGIEIIARPPGKELRSISLMSGGEKTLTAVALLLAIFRSKPSPFCILDEVDAALDEENIGRFTAVLREFLDRSQFIIITHSKRTMAVADVLYGITMQESGISKRVAVRFEDYREEPQPASPAHASENGSANGAPVPLGLPSPSDLGERVGEEAVAADASISSEAS